MKKTSALLLVLLFPALMHAQLIELPGKIKNKIRDKSAERGEKKIDQSVDNLLDIIEGKKQPSKESTATEKQTDDNQHASKGIYIKYDFIPGEEIIYSNDFSTDQLGEIPTGWNSNGNAAVVTLDDMKGNWVQLYQNATYLTDNKADFTENFTIEFDLILRKSNAKAAFPEFTWGILSSGNLNTTDNSLLKDYTAHFATEMSIQPSDPIRSTMQLQSYVNRNNYFKTDIQKQG